MSIQEIRQQLHEYIEYADDAKIQALHAAIESNISSDTVDISDEELQRWDEEHNAYLKGDLKFKNWDEVRANLVSGLKK